MPVCRATVLLESRSELRPDSHTRRSLSNQGFFGEVEWRHRLETGSYSVLVDRHRSARPHRSTHRPARRDRRPARLPRLNRIYRQVLHQPVLAVRLGCRSLQRQVFRPGLQHTFVQSWCRLHQGVDLDGLPHGPGRSQLFQPSKATGSSACRSSTTISNNRWFCPLLDYNRTFGLAPDADGRRRRRGEARLQSYESQREPRPPIRTTGTRLLDSAFSLYDVCPTSATPVAGLPNFKPPSCFMRGIAGDYSRASTQVSWERKFIDPIGEVWKPFAFVRADGRWLNLNESNSIHLHECRRAIDDLQRRSGQLLRHA